MPRKTQSITSNASATKHTWTLFSGKSASSIAARNANQSRSSCQNELRECLETTDEDGVLQSAASAWHSLCSSITFTPTTPVISTVSLDGDEFCATAIDRACRTAAASSDQCSRSATNLAGFSSCVCQPSVILYDYSCEYIGNTTCLGVPATLSEMYLYDCPNFSQVLAANSAVR